MISLKKRLAEKQPVLGSWLMFGYTGTVEGMAKAGFEFLVVDMEHTATGQDQCFRMIQTVELAGAVPMVRVGANDPLLIKRALDCGAHGVIVPMVNTPEEARKAVQAAYYPPIGTRGVGLFRAQAYGAEFEKYRAALPKEMVVIAQIEHHIAVDNLEAILDVEGIDGFIIGPYDLSGSIGAPGEFTHPRFLECLDKVHKVLKTHSKPGGYHIVNPDMDGKQLKEKIDLGYRFIAYGIDMIFFTNTVRDHTARLRNAKLL